jgi:hypothetical protein
LIQWEPNGIMQFTNYQGRDSALRCPRGRGAALGDGKTKVLNHSFRPAGRGRRSAASLPSKKFVKDIIAEPKHLN